MHQSIFSVFVFFSCVLCVVSRAVSHRVGHGKSRPATLLVLGCSAQRRFACLRRISHIAFSHCEFEKRVSGVFALSFAFQKCGVSHSLQCCIACGLQPAAHQLFHRKALSACLSPCFFRCWPPISCTFLTQCVCCLALWVVLGLYERCWLCVIHALCRIASRLCFFFFFFFT